MCLFDHERLSYQNATCAALNVENPFIAISFKMMLCDMIRSCVLVKIELAYCQQKDITLQVNIHTHSLAMLE